MDYGGFEGTDLAMRAHLEDPSASGGSVLKVRGGIRTPPFAMRNSPENPRASGGSVLKDSFKTETNLEDALHPTPFCICLPSIVNKFPLPSAKHKKRRSPSTSSFRLFLLLKQSLRKRGDSNPRYSYPYDSLANCWFQPLTHPSSGEKSATFFDRTKVWIQSKLRSLNESDCKSTAFF